MNHDEALQAVLDTLNDAFRRDPKAMQTLMLITRIPCTKQLGEHATIPVEEADGVVTVGALGVLNGVVFGLTGQMVAADWSRVNGTESPQLLGFARYMGQLPRKAVESGLQPAVR
jgi:hypothetical protein